MNHCSLLALLAIALPLMGQGRATGTNEPQKDDGLVLLTIPRAHHRASVPAGQFR